MKNHFIDTVNVIIDSNEQQLVTITGMGEYNPNLVKAKASEMVRTSYPNSRLASVIIDHRQVTVEEYKMLLGTNPPWFGNIEK